MAVPLLDVNAQNLALESELKDAFARVLHSGQFILGPEVTAFEQEVASFIGVRHAIGISSGTDAILLALMALDIKPGDEVLCPSFTFFATAGCIARLGATPIFVDSDPDTFNINLEDAAAKITARTRAIMPVHLFGQSAPMDEIMELARAHRMHVIEDAAQSLGARYKGKGSGAIGTFGAYSFFPSKNLGGLGDGGLLATNDDALAERARLLRTHGAKPKYYHKYVGGNFRLDSLQAAFLRVKLPHYAAYADGRRANAEFYTGKLSKIPGVALASEAGTAAAGTRLILPIAREGNTHVWNQYTLRVPGADQRDALRAFLSERSIGSEIYYPVPLHKQECFRDLGQQGGLPCATSLAEEVVSIPIYAEMTAAQREEVAAAIASFLQVPARKPGS